MIPTTLLVARRARMSQPAGTFHQFLYHHTSVGRSGQEKRIEARVMEAQANGL